MNAVRCEIAEGGRQPRHSFMCAGQYDKYRGKNYDN